MSNFSWNTFNKIKCFRHTINTINVKVRTSLSNLVAETFKGFQLTAEVDVSIRINVIIMPVTTIGTIIFGMI